jgi:hypothetical protein
MLILNVQESHPLAMAIQWSIYRNAIFELEMQHFWQAVADDGVFYICYAACTTLDVPSVVV